MQNAIVNTNGTINQTSGPTVIFASAKEDNSAVQGVFSNAGNFKGDTSPLVKQAETFCKNIDKYCILTCEAQVQYLCGLVTDCRDDMDQLRDLEKYRDKQIGLWEKVCSEYWTIGEFVNTGGNPSTINLLRRAPETPLSRAVSAQCHVIAQDLYNASTKGWSKPWTPPGSNKPFPQKPPVQNDELWRIVQFCYTSEVGRGMIDTVTPGVLECVKQASKPRNP